MSKAENLVVMFTDIVGFTELTSNQSRQQNQTMLRQNEKLLGGVAKNFGGKRIKSIGDALLLVFKSPTDAVHCAMAMHDALWEYNQTVTEVERLSIRVSLNSGEVRIDGGDVFGEPVNVAARLEGMTPPNEVYFTEAIYLSMNKAEVANELVGKHKLKGIPEEVTIYRVPRSASAQRLVAVGSDEDIENQYPFGGMHRVEKSTPTSFASKMPNLPFKKIGIAAFVVVLAIASFLFWPQSKSAAHKEMETLLNSNNLISLDALIKESLTKDSNDAVALFMQGHIKIERRKYKEALNAYGLALSQDLDLADDERYAKNLLKAMSGNGAKVTELAKLSPADAVVAALTDRSLRSGIKGRRDAAYILREIDRKDQLDSVAIAMLDLKEGRDCAEKRAAVKVLENRKDKRALPALKAVLKASVMERVKTACIYTDVKKAIKTLGG